MVQENVLETMDNLLREITYFSQSYMALTFYRILWFLQSYDTCSLRFSALDLKPERPKGAKMRFTLGILI